ncbi:formyltetrahydrofolate deformylase [Rubinisphaera margarita]|uniref:formyltetrahydrofolate deformylase n=1 Tax=Rubinisphaera margarita TaxID=2909586 RepID=UPI001EE8DCE9|nr:formyltransferase family protein [Rubinisphaera margarita]MCG6157087.1 formyltetrahydrofolate deformylase [Rubinisphaera margarita]
MQVTITAVGPDNRGLADPIVHYVTGAGANIYEIQMYDRDSEHLFAMMLRLDWPTEVEPVDVLRKRLDEIGRLKGLSIRTWARDEHQRPPRLAICTTYRPEISLALLRNIRDGRLKAQAAVMLGNREACRNVAEQFEVPWESIGDDNGKPDNDKFVEILDKYEVDYIILARYMQILPPRLCWEFAGGRIINLHHGLLPSFPGFRPYHDAYSHHMLTYGATAHFIVPELDAGNQIINQTAFTVLPGTPLNDIIRQGESDNEPTCLVEAVRRVVDREVELHFHRVVRTVRS